MNPSFDAGFWGVRYQVADVGRSVEFYTRHIGFKVDRQALPAFAQVSIGHLKLILSGPGASGSRPMPDGHRLPDFLIVRLSRPSPRDQSPVGGLLATNLRGSCQLAHVGSLGYILNHTVGKCIGWRT